MSEPQMKFVTENILAATHAEFREDPRKTIRAVRAGDVVQLDPRLHLGEANGFYAGCFMIVDEVKAWGAMGHILCPQDRGVVPMPMYYRANWDEMNYVGPSHWMIQ